MLGRITLEADTPTSWGGHQTSWTNQQSISINPPSAATLPIYPGLGQAQEYAGLHTPMDWLVKELSQE